MKSASISDAYVLIKSEDVNKATLAFLYEWMVEKFVGDGRVFEIFALAFQRPGLRLDCVSLEQNFASRATQLYKKKQQVASNEIDKGASDARNDDEADEF